MNDISLTFKTQIENRSNAQPEINFIHHIIYTHKPTHTPFQWTQWCPEVNDDWSWLTEASVWVVATDGCGCAGGLKLLKSKQPPRLTSWLITSSTLHSTGGNLSKLMLSSSNDRCDEPIICPTTVADMLSSCWSFNMLSNDIHSWKGKKYKFQVYTCFWKQIINLLYVKNWEKYMTKTDFTIGRIKSEFSFFK